MSWMFSDASNFNKIPDPNIEIPDTSQVTYMSGMFFGASAFNQPIGNWDTSKVKNMSYMFSSVQSFDGFLHEVGYGYKAYNPEYDSEREIQRLIKENKLKRNAFNQDISNWDLSKVSVWSRDNSGGYPDLMFANTEMLSKNYENALKALQKANSDGSSGFMSSLGLTYCDTTSRDALIAKGWFIEGDTHSCDTPKPAPTATNTSANQTNSGQSAAKNAAEIKTKSQSQTGAKDNQTLAETGFNIWPVIAAFASILLGGVAVMRKAYTKK